MADEKWLKIPYFGRGKAESLDRALTTGRFKDGLDKALFFFATDTKQWVLVDTDKVIHKINSYEGQPIPPGPGGEGSVKRVDALPPVLEGDKETLYIMGNVVYTFDGTAYYPTYNDVIGMLPAETTVVEYVNTIATETVDNANQYTDEQIQLHVVKGDG